MPSCCLAYTFPRAVTLQYDAAVVDPLFLGLWCYTVNLTQRLAATQRFQKLSFSRVQLDCLS